MHICFLDIDGTLVLTGGAGQTAFARTLAEDFGIAAIDQTVQFAGRSDRAIAMDLFRSHGVPPTAENWLRFYRGYITRLEKALATHQGFILPGVVALLAALAARGDVALGLLTGNVREGARHKLSYYGLWHHFDFGGFGDEYLERCDIAAAALTAARLHLDGKPRANGHHENRARPGELIVIGDTLNDIICGRSIDARCVAVPTGNTSAEVLRTGKPDVLVETLEDIEPILSLLDLPTI
jgi:phosphoglycolate phosphatase-like HAD superfamily hydrolase